MIITLGRSGAGAHLINADFSPKEGLYRTATAASLPFRLVQHEPDIRIRAGARWRRGPKVYSQAQAATPGCAGGLAAAWWLLFIDQDASKLARSNRLPRTHTLLARFTSHLAPPTRWIS